MEKEPLPSHEQFGMTHISSTTAIDLIAVVGSILPQDRLVFARPIILQ
jgi:hypothetical protein